jgi:hypothetical protein
MCGGGGGDPAKEQQKYDQQRQAKVDATTAQIRDLYNSKSREADIAKYQADAQKLYMHTLDQQSGEAARQLKFALARTGQTAGQVAVDKGADMTKQYNEGVLKVQRAAGEAAARLRQSDADSQQNLIQMAQNGMDMGTANTLALQGIRTNLLAANSSIAPSALGNAFSGLADTYQFSQEAKNYQRGYEQAAAGGAGAAPWMTSPQASNGNTSMPPWMLGGGT